MPPSRSLEKGQVLRVGGGPETRRPEPWHPSLGLPRTQPLLQALPPPSRRDERDGVTGCGVHGRRKITSTLSNRGRPVRVVIGVHTARPQPSTAVPAGHPWIGPNLPCQPRRLAGLRRLSPFSVRVGRALTHTASSSPRPFLLHSVIPSLFSRQYVAQTPPRSPIAPTARAAQCALASRFSEGPGCQVVGCCAGTLP